MAERKQYGRWTRSPENGVMKCTLADKRVLSFPLNQIHGDCTETCLGYGLKQKLADSASDADNLGEYVASIQATWERVKAGQWEAERVWTFQREPVIEAVMKASKGKYPRAKVEELDDAALKELAKKPAVVVAMREIALEKAKEAAKQAEPLDIKFD
jgi:hypothetical protein